MEITHYLFAATPIKEITCRMEELGFFSIPHSGMECKKDGGSYIFVENEWKEAGEKYLAKVKDNPACLDKANQDAIQWGKKLFDYGYELLKKDYKNRGNQELADLYNKFEFLHEEAHFRRCPMWVLETGDEVFSQYLIKYLGKEIAAQKLDLNPDVAFAVLSTPLKKNNAAMEREEFLRLAFDLKSDPAINDGLIKERLAKHVEKYCWLPYGITGPAWGEEYFFGAMKELLKKDINKIEEELDNLEKSLAEVKKQQEAIRSRLKLNESHQVLIKLAQDAIDMKSFTKEALFFGYYAAEKLFLEIAERLKIDLRLLRRLMPWEIGEVLKRGQVDRAELEKRYEHSILFVESGKTKVVTGEKAKKLATVMQLYKACQAIGDVNELKGNCARMGYAKGVVRIINKPIEMSKINHGDILVSKMTDPEIMSAMKKAAAIVTDIGGITCHAAIVSRELSIPCVIGTKIATKVLKDGDVVEVDATHGIIRIIRS